MQIKTKFVSYLTADSKPVKQEVNSTVILPTLVFLGLALENLSTSGQIFVGKILELTQGLPIGQLHLDGLLQGSLTEEEGSVQLTSLY